jgi:Leucine-rich repeat (LRR) protein
MEINLRLDYLKKYSFVLISLFCTYRGMAQFEDKSYLKQRQSDPDINKHLAQFVPNSKYGLVVSSYNLSEALKNPEQYKSARFNSLGLTVFPEELFLFPNLEEIDISRNNLTSLPSRLNELKHLKELHVNKNQLTSLNNEIISCTTLEVLQIQNNPLQSISKEIGTMNALKEITLGEVTANCIVPLELWNLTGLKKLKITNANLTAIPPAVGQLQQLDALCLTNNLITEVPEALFSLKNLTYLNLGNNKINSISPLVQNMEKLDYFGIYYNPLVTLPETINSLKNLTYLSCWKTNIPQQEIDKLKTQLPKTHVHNTETGIY